MTNIANKMKEMKILSFDFYMKLFPFLEWLQTYNLSTLRGDVIAGITVGLLIIPQGIAYATLAGLPAEYGLYTALTPGIIYCLFGTSKDVSIGPTVTMALFTYRFNPTHHPIGGSALAFFVGVVLLAMAILKLGFIAKFMPMHVNSGFVSAAAVVVAISQLKNLFGFSNAPSTFVGKIVHFVTHVKKTNQWDLILGCSCILFLLFFMLISRSPLKKLQQKEGRCMKALSNTLWFLCIARSGIVCVLGTIVSYLAYAYGKRNLFSLAGKLPTGLPKVQSPFESVVINNSTITTIDFIESFGTALVVLPVIQFVQSISIAKAFGKIYKYDVDSTQELVALAFANMFGSFFGGWPVTGSFSGSAVNAMSGTMTPGSSVIACGIVFLAVGFMMPWFYFIPKTVLAAMITMAVVTMIDYKTPIRIWKVKKIDLIPYTVAFLGTFYRLEIGVLAGAVISLLIMVSYEVNPKHEVIHGTDDRTVTVVFKGNLSYPSIEFVKETISMLRRENLHTLKIDMGYVYNIDYAVINSLRTLVAEMKTYGVFVDFVNFIDSNVEESFQRGKVESLGKEKRDKYVEGENDKTRMESKLENDICLVNMVIEDAVNIDMDIENNV